MSPWTDCNRCGRVFTDQEAAAEGSFLASDTPRIDYLCPRCGEANPRDPYIVEGDDTDLRSAWGVVHVRPAKPVRAVMPADEENRA